MKKMMFSALIFATTSCGYRRIGDLNMISNRNIDSSQKYELLQRSARSKCRIKKRDALEITIDRVVEDYNGEYLMNAKIYLKRNGRKIMVEGDVWGIKETQMNNQN